MSIDKIVGLIIKGVINEVTLNRRGVEQRGAGQRPPAADRGIAVLRAPCRNTFRNERSEEVNKTIPADDKCDFYLDEMCLSFR